MPSRKLQQVGGGTFTVSLPKEWAGAHDFEAGDEVYLDPHADGRLVIENRSQQTDRLGACNIALSSTDVGFACAAIGSAYRTGYDSMTVSFPEDLDSTDRQQFEECVSELLGLEIVELSDTSVTARCLLDTTDVSIRQSIQQLGFVTTQTVDAMTAALHDEAEVTDLTHRSREAERTLAMLEREFNRSLITIGSIDGLDVDRVSLYRFLVTARQLTDITQIASEVFSIAQRDPIESDDDLPIDFELLCDRSGRAIQLAVEGLMGDTPIQNGRQVYELYAEVTESIDTTTHRELQSASTESHKLRRILDRLGEIAATTLLIAETGMQSSEALDSQTRD